MITQSPVNVPFLDLKAQFASIREEIANAIDQVLVSGQFVSGPWIEGFEEEFARFVGARYAVGVSSGTAALELALKAARIGPRDEVIVPANSFFATAEAVSNVGARAVFGDVDPTTYHLDVASVERLITSRTRAIIPVHLYGRAMDLTTIQEIADLHGLIVIEDAAQAHGSERDGTRVGGSGRLTCFSFYPGKNLGAYGDAGAVTCNDPGQATRLRLLRDHGSPAKYVHSIIGTNARLDAIQAAVLSVKLSHLPDWNARRVKHAKDYVAQLQDAGIALPEIPGDREHNFHLFVIRVKERNSLRHHLESRGIQTGIHYPTPLHLTPAYQRLGYHRQGSLPVSERLADEIVSLPMYPELGDSQVEQVTEAILESFHQVEAAATGPSRLENCSSTARISVASMEILHMSNPRSPQPSQASIGLAERIDGCQRCVPDLFAEQAIQNPERPAVAGSSMTLTYGELESRANQLAHHLQTLGVGPEVRVGICMSRSPLMVVAALAVFKAGGAYLPVDRSYPVARVSYLLTDSSAAVVITDAQSSSDLPQGDWRLLVLDDDASGLDKYPSTPPGALIAADDLAYVIYTSGSTGTPKGVEITHGSLSNLVSWHQKAFAVTPFDRATQFASFGFDAAVWELWPHLTAGAAVHITPEDIRSSPESLRDWIVEQQVTISFVPTAMAEQLISLDWPVDTKLRFLLTGADTLHRYPRAGLPFVLINNYGPTEATVVATSGSVAADGSAEQRPTIGFPIDHTRIHILDQSLNPVLVGEIGELYIGGAGVARGYINNAELTAQKFLPDRFASEPGARMYRTGDLARRLPDGQLAYVGRVDNLLKIRGYRIEPNEIASVLNRDPAVKASAVVARANGAGNPCLLAYIVAQTNGHILTPASLRDLVRSQLPDYMVPAVFVKLPALPLTANGKLDRDALPAPDETNMLQDADYTSPRTVLEQKLAALIAHLLGLERVGVDDNIFLLGGHSLFGTQLIARIRDMFGVDLPLRSVFDSPTAAQLGQQIERMLVAQVDAMTEDQVQQTLEQAGSSGGPQ